MERIFCFFVPSGRLVGRKNKKVQTRSERLVKSTTISAKAKIRFTRRFVTFNSATTKRSLGNEKAFFGRFLPTRRSYGTMERIFCFFVPSGRLVGRKIKNRVLRSIGTLG